MRSSLLPLSHACTPVGPVRLSAAFGKHQALRTNIQHARYMHRQLGTTRLHQRITSRQELLSIISVSLWEGMIKKRQTKGQEAWKITDRQLGEVDGGNARSLGTPAHLRNNQCRHEATNRSKRERLAVPKPKPNRPPPSTDRL